MITISDIHSARILVVDDQEANVRLLEHLLATAGYTAVTSTMDPRTVIALHRVHRYDLIVLDLNMPYLDGFQILDQLKQIETDGYLPVLVMTAEPAHKLRALEAGARDFVSKPFDHVEVLTRIRNMLEVRLLYTATRDYSLHLAHYDTLTGLPNRPLFHKTLNMVLRQAQERQRPVALMFVDLDNFKGINDALGHALGDELLRQVSKRLLECITGRDMIARLGGDEFALILTTLDEQEDAEMVAHQIKELLLGPFTLDEHEVLVTASIGITAFPDDAADADTLIKYADTAMYQAKAAGRDTYRFFTAEMNIEAQRRRELESALRKAVENQEFVLHYQPKVLISTGEMTGVEALIRWDRPGHGLVPPSQFVPILEETGLIVRVGAWVIETACRQISQWSQFSSGPTHVAVNVSSRQFADGNLEWIVAYAIKASGIEADALELEITESSLMEDAERTITTLRSLKAQGVRLSIDDFGTGYSSLAYLKRFPIDTLKIDIAFVRDITSSPDSAAIAVAIIGMAHSLKMEVIAEGVETAAQLAYLRLHHCDKFQGYYFSRAVSAEELEQMLFDKKKLAPPPDADAAPTRTLLIVDDEVNVLKSLRRLLRQDGYRILTASSAAEGFELLALNPVHVILCDQRMPEMNGTEFLDAVKEMYPDTFRIVLSGYTDLDTIMEAINRGSLYRFFTKPWDGTILRNNIRDAFRHHWQMHGLAPAQGMAPD